MSVELVPQLINQLLEDVICYSSDEESSSSSSSSSSSDSSEVSACDSDLDYEVFSYLNVKRRKLVKITDYVTVVVPAMDDEEFRQNFRLGRPTFELLLQEITPLVSGKKKTEREKLLYTLWFLGSKETYRESCMMFNLTRSSGWNILHEVVQALLALVSKYIKWPALEKQDEMAQRYSRLQGFPGCIGSIDGCHIAIAKPKENPRSYYNRKSFTSVLLQGICDNNEAFTHVSAGWPGCVHDSHMFEQSEVSDYIGPEARDKFAGPSKHIIGDKAYTLTVHLMTPFRRRGVLTAAQRNYNVRHSSTRMVIERAFGHLKGRWRRMLFLDMRRVDLAADIIICCCLLHNICVFQGEDTFEAVADGQESSSDDDDDGPGQAARQNVHRRRQAAQRAGQQKRNTITAQLPP